MPEGTVFSLDGEPAYPLRVHLITPFKGAFLNNQEKIFNSRMSKLRSSVEWTFGKILSLFAFVDYKKNQKLFLQPVAQYYLVATLLTKCHTCLYGSVTSEYFNLLLRHLRSTCHKTLSFVAIKISSLQKPVKFVFKGKNMIVNIGIYLLTLVFSFFYLFKHLLNNSNIILDCCFSYSGRDPFFFFPISKHSRSKLNCSRRSFSSSSLDCFSISPFFQKRYITRCFFRRFFITLLVFI